MNRFVLPAVATALLATPAAAIPPPPEVAVVVLAPGGADAGPDDGNHALLAAISPADGGGWLRLVDAAFAEADFAVCAATGAADEGCVRETLAARGAAQMTPPTVVVLVAPGPGFSVSWTCVGVGEAAFQPDRQRISVDFLGWRSEGRFSPEQVSGAAGCLTSAAAESGW